MISPVAVPSTIIEANSLESELRVMVPVPAILVKSPMVVRDPVFSMVRFAEDSTLIALNSLSSSKVKCFVLGTNTLEVAVGTDSLDQLLLVVTRSSCAPCHTL